MNVGNINLSYVRPLKMRHLQRRYDSLQCRDELSVITLADCRLTFLGEVSPPPKDLPGTLFVDDNDRCAVAVPRTSLSKQDAAAEVAYLKGRTLYGGYIRRIWGHFLLGFTGRLWQLVYESALRDYDHIVFHSDMPLASISGNYREMFRLLGLEDWLDNGRIVFVDRQIDVEKLVVGELSYEHDVYFSPQMRDLYKYIRSRALRGFTPFRSDRKIFLTRSQLRNATRDEVNIELLDRFFADAGYEVVAPEKFSLTELIRMMAEASDIAGISGSTTLNFAFAEPKPGRRFTILERHPHFNLFQLSLDKMMGYEVTYVDAQWLPRFVSSQGRVALFGMTPQFKAFAAERGFSTAAWNAEDPKADRRRRRRELRRFFSRCRRYYGESESVEPWEIVDADVLAEAAVATREHYPEWLERHYPLTWYDWLTPRMLLRRLLK